MKKDVIQAVGWGITAFIGLCIVCLIKGGEIDILLSLIGGIVFAAIHYVFSLIGKRKKR